MLGQKKKKNKKNKKKSPQLFYIAVDITSTAITSWLGTEILSRASSRTTLASCWNGSNISLDLNFGASKYYWRVIFNKKTMGLADSGSEIKSFTVLLIEYCLLTIDSI